MKERPKLSDSSLKIYVSILSSLYKRLGGKDISFFSKEKDVILKSMKDVESNKRKTTLSAPYILTNIEDYKTLMLKDCSIDMNKRQHQKKVKIGYQLMK